MTHTITYSLDDATNAAIVICLFAGIGMGAFIGGLSADSRTDGPWFGFSALMLGWALAIALCALSSFGVLL